MKDRPLKNTINVQCHALMCLCTQRLHISMHTHTHAHIHMHRHSQCLPHADVSATEVKALRKQTGAGMMDCKKALAECEGNADKAVEVLLQ